MGVKNPKSTKTNEILTKKGEKMGEVRVHIDLENFADRSMFTRNMIKKSEIRRYLTDGVVDTGAIMLMLPQDVVETLGLEILRTVVVTYADDRKEERPIAGMVTIKIENLLNRFMTTECIVGPPSSTVLIGQVILEELDLIPDCQNRTLSPRPESPIYPLLNMK